MQTRANNFAVQMELDFKGDTLTLRTPREKQTCAYKVVRSDKTSLVVVTDRDGPADEQTLSFVDDDSLRWRALDAMTVRFLRDP